MALDLVLYVDKDDATLVRWRVQMASTVEGDDDAVVLADSFKAFGSLDLAREAGELHVSEHYPHLVDDTDVVDITATGEQSW